MKNKCFFLVGLPLVWLIVTMITHHRLADKAYLLSVAPSVWLFCIKDWDTITIVQMRMAALPVVLLIGVSMSWLKMKPVTAVIASVVLTLLLWVALIICGSQGTLIHEAGAIFVWLLCCFNLSICFLPFVAAGTLILAKIRSSRRVKIESV